MGIMWGFVLLLVMSVNCTPIVDDTTACHIGNIPEQENLDLRKMSGIWHTFGTSHHIWGEDSWISTIHYFVTGEDNTTVVTVTGYSEKESKCVPIHVATLADHHLSYGHVDVTLKIVHTDYDMAVVYQCAVDDHNIQCPHDKMDVSLWSRDPQVPNDRIAEMNQYVNLVCGDPDHIAFAATGKCKEPYISDSYVNSHLITENIHDVINVLASPGSTISLPCQFEPGHAKVVWLSSKHDNILTYGNMVVVNEPRYNIVEPEPGCFHLEITNTNVGDQAIYTCQTDTQHQRRVTVTIVEPSHILETFSTGDVQVTEGEDAHFFCNATGIPPPAIQWYWTPDSETATKSVLLGQTESELELHHANRSMAGKYTCVADNGFPPFSSLDMFLSVDFAPVLALASSHVGKVIGRDVILECKVRAEPFPETFWSQDGHQIPTDGIRRYVDIYQESIDTIILSLNIKNIELADFGIYTCSAQNVVGKTSEHMMLYEHVFQRDRCSIANINVQSDFDLNRFSGVWQRIKTTKNKYGDNTYYSETVAFNNHEGEGLEMMFRGYSPLTEKCVDPDVTNLEEISPGYYRMGDVANNAIYKIVYTDYEYAVTYMCHENHGDECSSENQHIEIISKHDSIPHDKLQLLELFVTDMCVDVKDMLVTVPGLCHFPDDFVAAHSFDYTINTDKCHMDRMQGEDHLDLEKFAGLMYPLAGTASPLPFAYTQPGQFILDVKGRLNLLLTPYSSADDACLTTHATLLTWDQQTKWWKHYFMTKPVQTKVIYTDYTNTVLFSCLHVGTDGHCAKHLLRILSKNPTIPVSELRKLKRHAVDLCIDVNSINHVNRITTMCSPPQSILQAVKAGELTGDPSNRHIGCKLKYIPVAPGLTPEKISGTHYTVYSSSHIAPDNQHGPVHIVTTVNRGIVIVHSAYNEVSKTCGIPAAMSVPPTNEPGNYSFDRKGARVISRMVHIDGDNHNAVIYKCFKVTSDGYCDPDYEFSKILSRDKTISAETYTRIKQAVMSKCIDVSKLQPVVEKETVCSVSQDMLDKAKSGTLPQGFTRIGCMLNFIPLQAEIDTTRMVGAWNTILTTDNIPRLKSSTSRVGHMVISDKHEVFMIRRSFSRAWKSCMPPVVIRLYPTGRPGDFTAVENHRKSYIKIVYTDYTNSVVYICFSVLSDGTCDPEELFVTISSRKSALTMVEMQQLQSHVASTCVNFANMIFSAPGHCPIPANIIQAVQQGEIHEDFSLPLLGCNGHVVPVHENLNTSRLLGSWNHLYRPDTFMGHKTAKSKISQFIPIKGGLLRLWRGYNDTVNLCRPTEAGTKFEASGPGDYYYAAKHYPVIFKIIYTDYTDAVTLSCLGVSQDGKCMPGRLLVEIISKNTAIGADSLQPLFKHVEQACGTVADLGKKLTGLCTVPPSLIDSAKAGEVKEDYTVVQCKAHLIPVQDGFDIDKFVGKWNILKKTRYVSGEQSSISQQRWLIHSDAGHIIGLEKEYSPVPVDSCNPTRALTLEPADRPGHFTVLYHNVPVIFKVIYTDYVEAVVYFCLGVGPDGTCLHNKLQIEIWSRQDSISDSKFQLLRHHVADSCADVNDLVDVTPGLCEIPSDLAEAVQFDQVHMHSDNNNVECQLRFIHTQEDFDFHQFEGVWHTLTSTHHIFKNNTWQSVVRSYVQEDGRKFSAYRGFAPTANKCTRTLSKELVEVGSPGNYSAITKSSRRVLLKVISTDYTSALVYTCVQYDHHGYCANEKDNLQIISRDINADVNVAMQTYRQQFRTLCFQETELVPTEKGPEYQCETPYYIGSKCLLSDIHIEENFLVLQLAGLWFQQSRTQFTHFKLEESTFFYSYDRENKHLDGIYTGTLDGVCQTPVTSITKHSNSGPEGNLLGRIGDHDSIYPWIPFRVVYFDGSNIVFYACYQEDEDGTCKSNQISVSILGRTHEMGEALRAKLPSLMTSLCLHESDLHPVDHKDCLSYITGISTPRLMSKHAIHELPNVSSCKLTDVQVATHIDLEQLLGVWYGKLSVYYGTQTSSPTNGFVLRIAKLTSTSYKILRQQDKNGTCHVVSDVMAKPVCAASDSGDFLSTTGSSIMTQWSVLKVLYVDDHSLVLYWCQRENDGGSCDIEGVRFEVLSRTHDDEHQIPLQETLQSVCLEPKHLYKLSSSEHLACHPETLPPPPTPPPIIPISSCAVDILPKTNVDMERISGYWYEVASPKPDPMFPLSNMVVYYYPLASEHIKMIYSGLGSDGTCQPPVYGDFKTRCLDRPDGRYLGRLNMNGLWTWNTMHILYTDYDHVTIAYSCMSEMEDGSCNPASAKAHILSRSTTLDETRRKRMDGIIYSACLSALEDNIMQDTCKSTVAEALKTLQNKVKA